MSKIIRSRAFQIVVALILGGAIGVAFYPTSSIETELRAKVVAEYSLKMEQMSESHKTEIENLHEKRIEETSSHFQSISDLSQKVSSLTEQNRQLHQKVTEKTYKLIKPDGTVIEKTFKSSDTEETNRVITSIQTEFTEKVNTLQNRYQKVHTERIKEIQKDFESKLLSIKEENKKTTSDISEKVSKITNPKRFGIEGGIDSRLNWYAHSTAIVYGPLFLGAHVSFDGYLPQSAGIGVGVSF